MSLMAGFDVVLELSGSAVLGSRQETSAVWRSFYQPAFRIYFAVVRDGDRYLSCNCGRFEAVARASHRVWKGGIAIGVTALISTAVANAVAQGIADSYAQDAVDKIFGSPLSPQNVGISGVALTPRW
jgi:hypothetical protein